MIPNTETVVNLVLQTGIASIARLSMTRGILSGALVALRGLPFGVLLANPQATFACRFAAPV